MFNCNCKVTEIVLGLVILVFALWETTFSKWVIVVAAILLLLHAFSCKNCGVSVSGEVPKAKSRRKRRR